MLFHILPALIDGPYGGGNQFAKALRVRLAQVGHYADSIDEANVLLFNGYPFREPAAFAKALRWKQQSPEVRYIISRIDGPIASIRHNPDSDIFDRAVYEFSNMAADGIVIQSQWSEEQMLQHPKAPDCMMRRIGNAPNPEIFHIDNSIVPHKGKIRIIASSWSSNPHKGFDVYAWLDKNLDFSRFEFTVVASTDYHYEKIKIVTPVDQEVLGEMLRNNDVFLTASRIESCTNASLEALHCGLPVIAPNDSSHPEFMPSPDLIYDEMEDIPGILEKLATNLAGYKNEISVASIDDIAEQYLNFAKEVSSKPSKMFSKVDATRFLYRNNLSISPFQRLVTGIKQHIKNAIFRR